MLLLFKRMILQSLILISSFLFGGGIVSADEENESKIENEQPKQDGIKPGHVLSNNQKVSNNKFDLSHYKGQFVYLDFWASWCGPCRASFPWMNTLQKDYQGMGLKIVSINLDVNREDAQEFLLEFPAKFDVIFDSAGNYAESFGLVGMPSSFFFDPEGKQLFSHVGFNQKDAPALREKIYAALNSEKSNAADVNKQVK